MLHYLLYLCLPGAVLGSPYVPRGGARFPRWEREAAGASAVLCDWNLLQSREYLVEVLCCGSTVNM